MEIIRKLQDIRESEQGCAVTIGNFDGLHLGHQYLLKALKEEAKKLGVPTCAIFFEPQPNEYFNPDANIPRLMRFREKVEAFKDNGIDRVVCLSFNDQMAHMTAELFVRTILVEKLSAKFVVVGDDFHFGYKRMGNFQLLKALGEKYHFRASCIDTFEILGERVSSTRIRKCLEAGDLEQARELLGRPYSMKGRVAHGDKRGRLIGVPTANIHLFRKQVPLLGVFAVKVMGLGVNALPGVANIGIRPTIQGDSKVLLEVHLLNFNQEIYGRQVEVIFLKKIRDEKKFPDFEQLKKQILADIEEARYFFVELIDDNA